MTLTERIFALRGVPGFSQLRDEELLAVAASMTERRYRPGAVILPAGGAAWHLLVVTAGGIRTPAGATLPAVVGADLLLANRPSQRTLLADPREGAICLRMSKGHFFTAINECPALLVDLIPIYAAAPDGADRP